MPDEDFLSGNSVWPRDKKVPARLKTKVFERDGFLCVKCKTKLDPSYNYSDPMKFIASGGNFLVVDHHEGGLQTLCFRCNAAKGGRGMYNFTLSQSINLLGRPIAFYPSIAKIIGIKEALFICQIIYWTPRSRAQKGDGWLYKSSDEIEQETTIDYACQKRIRASLVANGILEERYDREAHLMYFRINTEGFERYITSKLYPDDHLAECKVPPLELQPATLQNISSYRGTETTTETTQEEEIDTTQDLLPWMQRKWELHQSNLTKIVRKKFNPGPHADQYERQEAAIGKSEYRRAFLEYLRGPENHGMVEFAKLMAPQAPRKPRSSNGSGNHQKSTSELFREAHPELFQANT